jgi:hypothetical protein
VATPGMESAYRWASAAPDSPTSLARARKRGGAPIVDHFRMRFGQSAV